MFRMHPELHALIVEAAAASVVPTPPTSFAPDIEEEANLYFQKVCRELLLTLANQLLCQKPSFNFLGKACPLVLCPQQQVISNCCIPGAQVVLCSRQIHLAPPQPHQVLTLLMVPNYKVHSRHPALHTQASSLYLHNNISLSCLCLQLYAADDPESVETLTAKLKSMKNSNNRRDLEIFPCMIQSLFDEYRFFHKYPEKELQITAALFGGLINSDLIVDQNLGEALRLFLDAVRNPAGHKMCTFGLQVACLNLPFDVLCSHIHICWRIARP